MKLALFALLIAASSALAGGASVKVNVVPPATPPGPAVNVPTVIHSAIIASDGLSASVDRGNGHGGHQPRVTLNSDGTQRVIYVGGDMDGPKRWWKLMKRPPNGAWQLEAQGQTNNEAMLFRDPTTDLVHVVSYPGDRPHISSAPAFKALPIPGAWQPQGSPYVGLGVGVDGTVVLVNYFDRLLGGTYSKDTERHWAAGKWNGSAIAWGPVQKRFIGLRRAYNYVMPGAFGNAAEWAGVSEWAGKKEHSAPLVAGSYVWDGVYEERALNGDPQSHRLADLIPPRTLPTATEACWMAIQDSFADSRRRMFTLVQVSDPKGPSGMHLTVRSAAGVTLYHAVLNFGGNPRIVEDGKGRLWLIEFGDTTRIFPMNGSTYTLGSPTTLKFSHPYEGFGRIAAPRGGTAIGDVLAGAFPSGPHMVAFQIRLPA